MTDLQANRRRNLVWIAVGVLFALHHDFWWWDDRTLLLGFLPIGLAYHLLYSIAAGCLWAAAVRFAWPTHVEEFARGGEPASQEKERQS